MTVDIRTSPTQTFLEEIAALIEAHIELRANELSSGGFPPLMTTSSLNSSPGLEDSKRAVARFEKSCLEFFASSETRSKSTFIAQASDIQLKTLFKMACSAGEADSMSMIATEWSSRLFTSSTGDNGQFVECVRSGSVRAVEELIKLGVDISQPDIVLEAVATGNVVMVELILGRIPMERLLDALSSVLSDVDMGSSEEMREVLRSYRLVGLSCRGNMDYRESNFESAFEKYREALELCNGTGDEENRENLVKLHYNCGRTLYRLDRWIESIFHCSACIELDPTYLNAFSQRGQSSTALHDFEASKRDYERCIALLSASRSSMENASNRLRQVSDFRDRMSEIEKILKTDHYTVLGIERFAPETQIKASYRQLVRQLHPDKLPNDISEDIKLRSRNQFDRIQAAYQVLTGDEQTRIDYDVSLRIHIGTEKLRKSLTRRSIDEEVPRCSSPLESVYN